MTTKETSTDNTSLQDATSPRLEAGIGGGVSKLTTLEMNRLSVEEFHEAEKMPLVVVLDDVRSLHNVGSVFRTSDAFRVEALYLCGITGTPPATLQASNSTPPASLQPTDGTKKSAKTGTITPNPNADCYIAQSIHKTALGAEESVAWRHFNSAMEAIEDLRDKGYTILSVEQCHGSTMLQDFTPLPDRRYAVVLGNEVKGVHQEVIDMSDGCLEIPQYGTKHSLNVSVTAGIIIWHFAQHMHR